MVIVLALSVCASLPLYVCVCVCKKGHVSNVIDMVCLDFKYLQTHTHTLRRTRTHMSHTPHTHQQTAAYANKLTANAKKYATVLPHLLRCSPCTSYIPLAPLLLLLMQLVYNEFLLRN